MKPTRLLRLSKRYSTASAAPSKHLLSLADVTVPEISALLSSAAQYKALHKKGSHPPQLLAHKTLALMFSKRSTRTRVASESAAVLLGAHPMFLGASDIQLGVNESLYDTARIVGSMTDGIMARVGHHSEVQTLAEHSGKPVINALSHLYHPTQILADLLTMIETYSSPLNSFSIQHLRGLNVAWVGDSNNILNDMIVSFGRLGINLNIATPKGYALEEEVLETRERGLKAEEGKGNLKHVHDPEEAVRNADIVITDTWISMGQESEKAQRLQDFAGYQVTMDLMKRGGANRDWKFMHCLPRKAEEVDDEVFYSNRSLVFQEGENRKWTTQACFAHYFGQK